MRAMSEDLVQAAKAVEELTPAMKIFVEVTGILDPVRELSEWATDLIRYRRAPYQAKLLMRAVEKIKATGLPASAVSDRLLRAVLEDGAMEDDPTMQDRWANLLANASTGQADVRAAFPRMLSELDPIDAAILDEGAAQDARVLELYGLKAGLPKPAGVESFASDNLVATQNLARLGLIDRTIDVDYPGLRAVVPTALGRAFVAACNSPAPEEQLEG